MAQKKGQPSKRQWTGELAKPIKWTGLWPDGRQARSKFRYEAIMGMKKLPLLAEHYDIQGPIGETALFLLLRLAQDFVPGFRLERRGGHRHGYAASAVNDLLLAGLVATEKENGAKSDAEACERIAENHPQFNQKEPPYLQKRLSELRRAAKELRAGKPTARAKALAAGIDLLAYMRSDQGK
ncbi:MAG TPA: hypothetical protein VHU18_05950 [Rhizomicrobium sp.]|jgi:hypothetical protein|nr:hypothetical protein [Rhizomicrobium sp.]